MPVPKFKADDVVKCIDGRTYLLEYGKLYTIDCVAPQSKNNERIFYFVKDFVKDSVKKVNGVPFSEDIFEVVSTEEETEKIHAAIEQRIAAWLNTRRVDTVLNLPDYVIAK